MSNLGVWSESHFKNRTSPSTAGLNRRERLTKALDGRGAQIRLIDAALHAWDKIQTKDPAEVNADITLKKKKALRTVAKACAYWLSIKPAATYTSVLANHRRTQIQTVMAQAIGALGHFDPAEREFARKKTNAITGGRVSNPIIRTKKVGNTVKSVGGYKNANATALDGTYGLERAVYADQLRGQFGQGQAHFSLAAGAVHDMADDWDNLDASNYVRIYQDLIRGMGNAGAASKHVTYLPKLDRMQYLIMVNGGAFTVASGGAPYGTNPARVGAGQDRVGDMWAMDRYGNLFVKSSQRLNGHGYFNHSSFNAGNEVICAGGIVINNGALAYIDNQSGHYKPNENALREACTILSADGGVNFAGIRVGVLPANGGAPINYEGASFLAGNNAAWNHTNDAGLNLSAVIPLE